MTANKDVIELLEMIVQRLDELIAVNQRSPLKNAKLKNSLVTVATANTPVQGPDVPVPEGTSVSVTLRRDTDATHVGYLGSDKAAVQQDDTRRELYEEIPVNITGLGNLDELWFSADTADSKFDLTSISLE